MRCLAAAFVWLLPAIFLTGPAVAEPQRIISIGGAVTETVFALGEQDRLIAIDSTSLFPEAARKIPNVGYMRTLSAEPVLSLDPDMILLHADAGPDLVIEQLGQSGVTIVKLPKATTVDGTAELIRQIAVALGREDAGETLAAKVESDAGRVMAVATGLEPKPRVLFMLSIGRGAPLASGTGTAAEGIIEAAGGINVIDAYEGYKPLSPEAAVTANPDAILATYRTVERMGGEDAILSRAEIAPTAAGRDRRLIVVDGLLMMGFGPRVASAIEDLATALHPDADIPSAN